MSFVTHLGQRSSGYLCSVVPVMEKIINHLANDRVAEEEKQLLDLKQRLKVRLENILRLTFPQ